VKLEVLALMYAFFLLRTMYQCIVERNRTVTREVGGACPNVCIFSASHNVPMYRREKQNGDT